MREVECLREKEVGREERADFWKEGEAKKRTREERRRNEEIFGH